MPWQSPKQKNETLTNNKILKGGGEIYTRLGGKVSRGYPAERQKEKQNKNKIRKGGGGISTGLGRIERGRYLAVAFSMRRVAAEIEARPQAKHSLSSAGPEGCPHQQNKSASLAGGLKSSTGHPVLDFRFSAFAPGLAGATVR